MPSIVTPFLIFSGCILLSIEEVTAFTVILPLPEYPLLTVKFCCEVVGVIVLASLLGVTVIEVIPFLPVPGVKVLPLAEVKDSSLVSPLNSFNKPFTPNIDTPALILVGIMLLSILLVTAPTVKLVIPFFPFVGVINCGEVVGVILLVSPFNSVIVSTVCAKLLLFCVSGKVAPLLLHAV